MAGQFLINNKIIAYLIYRQSLCPQYQTLGCWFVVIAYNCDKSFSRKFYFRMPIGKFEFVTNVYSPNISLWDSVLGFKNYFIVRH